jgi:hypothetical protein
MDVHIIVNLDHPLIIVKPMKTPNVLLESTARQEVGIAKKHREAPRKLQDHPGA